MNNYRWVNTHQPQTLLIGVILCYIDAVFGILNFLSTGSLLLLLVSAGLGAGGFGIANEKKWGYAIAVAAAVVQVALLLVVFGASIFTTGLISLLLDGALVALLLHPMSRDYQRIWFK